MVPHKSIAVVVIAFTTIGTGAVRVKKHHVSPINPTTTTAENSKMVPLLQNIETKIYKLRMTQTGISGSVRLATIAKLVATARWLHSILAYANAKIEVLTSSMYHTSMYMGRALDYRLSDTVSGPKAFTELLKTGLSRWRPCTLEDGCNFSTDDLCGDTGRPLMFLFSNYVKTFTSLKETFAEASKLAMAEDAFRQHVSIEGPQCLHPHISAAEDFVQKEASSPRGAEYIVGAALDGICRIAQESLPTSPEPFGRGVGMILIGPPDSTRGEVVHGKLAFLYHTFNIEVSGDYCYILQSWGDRFGLQDWLNEVDGDSPFVAPSTSWRCLDRTYKPYLKGGGRKVEECEAWRQSRAKYGLGQPLKCDDLNVNPRASFFDMDGRSDMAQVYLDLIRFYLISKKQQKTTEDVEGIQFGIKAWPEPAAWNRLEDVVNRVPLEGKVHHTAAPLEEVEERHEHSM